MTFTSTRPATARQGGDQGFADHHTGPFPDPAVSTPDAPRHAGLRELGDAAVPADLVADTLVTGATARAAETCPAVPAGLEARMPAAVADHPIRPGLAPPRAA